MKYLEASAEISDCGNYRYLLTRIWDWQLRRALLIMLNPSTADGRRDDATIRSCVRLLSACGYGGFEVVNLFAWRATVPTDLPLPPSKSRGAGNARFIAQAAERCDRVICAWGAHKYAIQNCGGAIDTALLEHNTLYCFGKTASGAPRHPLYVKTGTRLQVFCSRSDRAIY